MRELFETEEHLLNERKFAQKLQTAFNCKLVKLSIKYHVDFFVERDNKLAGWLEVRCRNNSSTAYDSYMIGLDKWMNCLKLAEITNVPSVLAVRFTDCDKYVGINNKIDVRYSYGGRTVQKRDSQDAEPCVYIPMSEFKTI